MEVKSRIRNFTCDHCKKAGIIQYNDGDLMPTYREGTWYDLTSQATLQKDLCGIPCVNIVLGNMEFNTSTVITIKKSLVRDKQCTSGDS